MPDHEWGEENFDWDGLNDCVHIVSSTCRRWGRLGGQAKEKYGTLRFYSQFGYLSLHGLLLPGWVNYGWMPGWLVSFDRGVITPVLNWVPGLNKSFFWWQKKIYSWAYWRALKRYPHLEAEILECADQPEYIKGITKRDGNKLHIIGPSGKIVSTWTSY